MIATRMDAARKQLTDAQADCLEAIDQAIRMKRKGVKITAAQIARELEVTRQTAEKTIHRLRVRGYVAWTVIDLTGLGRAYIEQQRAA